MSHTARHDIAPDTLPPAPDEAAVDAPAAAGDAQPGREARPEHLDLLLALDRMLTIGSYYPAGHEKYVEVAAEAHAALRRALAGAPALPIEVAADGLALPGSFVPADRREARRLHQMLEPLNVALLEIDGDAAADDLHEALTTLKKHHGALSGARSYQEIAIAGLPDAVRTVGRSLYVRTLADGHSGPPRPGGEAFDPSLIPDAALVETPEGQKVEREFLAVIKGIMQSGDALKMRQLENAADDQASEVLSQWIPDEAIARIKDILTSLETANTDPMMLQHLIGHAQAALELTGDPELVELVFQKLRKEGEKAKPGALLSSRPRTRMQKRYAVTFTMTREHMRGLVDEVDSQAVPIADLTADTGPDCLGIAHAVLNAAPTETLRAGTLGLVRDIIAESRFGEREMRVITETLRAAMRRGTGEDADLLAPELTTLMREIRPERLGWLWLAVWEGLVEPAHKETAWPFIVNDLLLGLTWDDPADKLSLYHELSDFPVRERYDLLARLEEMPALREKALADDLFAAPAPLLYPVHQLLLRSSASEEHGPRLLQRLQTQQAHPLVSLLLRSLGEYDAGSVKLYQAMLDQGVVERVAPSLADAAGRYLKAIITRLDDSELAEEWVPEAVEWLGRLQSRKSEDVLLDIVHEKKWFFFPVWPAPARDAARRGLELLDEDTDGAAPRGPSKE